MSLVNYHESYGFDSLQKTSWWYDDFEGDSLKDYWRISIVGAGSIAVADGITGAAVRLTTSATSGQSLLFDWQDYRSLLVSKNVAFEVRAKCHSSEVMHFTVRLRALDSDDELWMQHYTPSSQNLFYAADGGGTNEQEDTSIQADTEWHNYRIQCHTHGSNHAHYYYDDTQLTNSPITTNITSEYLQPWIYCNTFENVAKTFDFDYVAWRQDR